MLNMPEDRKCLSIYRIPLYSEPNITIYVTKEEGLSALPLNFIADVTLSSRGIVRRAKCRRRVCWIPFVLAQLHLQVPSRLVSLDLILFPCGFDVCLCSRFWLLSYSV